MLYAHYKQIISIDIVFLISKILRALLATQKAKVMLSMCTRGPSGCMEWKCIQTKVALRNISDVKRNKSELANDPILCKARIFNLQLVTSYIFMIIF